jgi:hypothetical protein
MAIQRGTVTSFENTQIQLRAVSTLIDIMGWNEAALLKTIGLNNERIVSFVSGTWPTRQYEWLYDTLPSQSGTLAAALNNVATTFTVQTNEGLLLRDGDVVLIDDEYMRVTSVSGDTITVTRGYAGTTAAAHNSGAAWQILFSARREGQDATDSNRTEVEYLWNMRQIFETTVSVSGSEKVFRHLGGEIGDIAAYHLAKAIGGDGVGPKYGSGILARQLVNAFYYGRRHKATTNNDADAMGGLSFFVTQNTVNANGEALTRKMIVDLLQTIYENGGKPDMIITGMWGRRKISSFFEGNIRTERTEEQGGSVISSLKWEGGEIDVMYDRWCPPGRLYIVNNSLHGFVTIRPFSVSQLAKTGDSERSEVVGEYGYVIRRPNQDFGYIYNFSTTR